MKKRKMITLTNRFRFSKNLSSKIIILIMIKSTRLIKMETIDYHILKSKNIRLIAVLRVNT